jgi:ribosomal protein S18 acetylase RimI-like enzyme
LAVSWTLRAGTHSDIDAVLGLWADADAAPTHTDDAESLGKLLAHDPAALILAEDRGVIVGSVIGAWDGWRGSVYRLVVAPAVRRLGLGTQLLDAAEARMTAVGAVRLQAIVVETDADAVAYWQASGWEQQVERLRFVKG